MKLVALKLALASVVAAAPHVEKAEKPHRIKWRKAIASVYGTNRPGDTWTGNPLGCGGTFTPDLVAVANKTMPCGSKLTLGYGRFSVRVRVRDRGPYVAGRTFDVTAGAASLIHMPVAVVPIKWKHGWGRTR